MSGLWSHTKDLDSTLGLRGSHLGDLNKGITWSNLSFFKNHPAGCEF